MLKRTKGTVRINSPIFQSDSPEIDRAQQLETHLIDDQKSPRLCDANTNTKVYLEVHDQNASNTLIDSPGSNK